MAAASRTVQRRVIFMSITDKQAVESAKMLTEYCKENKCGTCILKHIGICVSGSCACPAFWKVR